MPIALAPVERRFTAADVDPLDAIKWERRDAWPGVEQYHRPDLEVPTFWSQQSLDIVSKLYLAKGDYEEDSVRTLIRRPTDKITSEGVEAGYFDPDVDALPFHAELCHILVNQLGTFNSPVWFNIGRDDRTQCCSACFLLHVDDTSESILKWGDDEAFIFKAGSGSGANISNIRGSMEPLSTGGIASGPVSFMRVPDTLAGTFKSGGTTRRAAKLVRLDADHPDIEDFIETKVREERRLYVLAASGEDISLGSEGERNVAEFTSYQNANISVGVNDDFMERATGVGRHPSEWPLLTRKTGEIVKKVSATKLLDKIAQAAWECADPGLQFDTRINLWHTTPEDDRIRTSNPCAETFLPDVSSCNLAHLNVLKYVLESGDFMAVDFRHVVDTLITAMDILVDFCELPTEELTRRTKQYRWLGLGYSNLGAAIMAQGLAYDSEEARDFAASITALLTGRAYRQSALLAERLGPFEGFHESRDSMLGVIDRHISHIPQNDDRSKIWNYAEEDWHEAASLGQEHGYRNAQATAIAPTGTTSFMMGCDTTGLEPAHSLVTHKDLAGGGQMVLLNGSVERGLAHMMGSSDIERSLETLQDAGSDAFLSELDDMNGPDHKVNCEVFYGANEISAEGHVKMVAAVQPFVSQGISKTVNVPESATWEEIREIYVMAWRLGCKAISIYRDGSKARQVLMSKPKIVNSNTGEEVSYTGRPAGAVTPNAEDQYEGPVGPERRRMPRNRTAHIHKFNVGGHEGYLICGEYDDGTLGEIFLEDIGKEGSHVRGMANCWAIAMSIGLQYGTSLEALLRKYTNMNFEPNGPTENPMIPTARSIPDYAARYLVQRYLPHLNDEFGILTEDVKRRKAAQLEATEIVHNAIHFGEGGEVELNTEALVQSLQSTLNLTNTNGNGNGVQPVQTSVTAQPIPVLAHAPDMVGPPCGDCGTIMVRAGTCYSCPGCGNSTGCG